MAMSEPKYRMSMSLSVLNQLGINLYSAIPPVLSEAVANAWDADAENVDITISTDEIVIEDDGHGMTIDDANDKYLFVGYERRKDNGARTPKHKRKVMGRKGIGKLSLFSIANIVEVHSAKDGERHGFRLDVKEIEKTIKNKKGGAEYHPEPIENPEMNENGESGTRIILKELKIKRLTNTVTSLKKRIARRFSILGEEYHFEVKIDDSPVSIEDRDYFHKIQYLWYFGKESERYLDYCKHNKIEHKELRGNEIKLKNSDDDEDEIIYKITGWIGTVKTSGDLKDGDDNLNKLVIMVRGKLAQEDILEDFTEGGLFTKYLIGEIHADFFDLDNEDDSATSNRQEIIKDDSRYKALKNWINRELKYIKGQWTDLRNKKGKEEALSIPKIREWFDALKPKTKKKAEVLFGKINQLTLEPEEKKMLFKHGILAFESLRYKENLDALDKINPENIKEFTEIIADHDDIEATLYHQIVKERLTVINTLYEKIEENAYEKVLQEYLYDHLWLLDPSWDRATETPSMEQTVKKEFDRISDDLTPEEANARYDIKYKKSSGKHVIIELKRKSVKTDSADLWKQVRKYYNALKKLIKEVKEKGDIEIICLVGNPLKDWTDDVEKKKDEESLAAKNVRVVLYQELINDSLKSYGSFLEKQKEAGRVTNLIQSIE
jgi:hypothetical protein